MTLASSRREGIDDELTINYAKIGINNHHTLNILKQRNDCEAIMLLAELFNDNKDILYNENIMEEITI
jgi:hypothetical protein